MNILWIGLQQHFDPETLRARMTKVGSVVGVQAVRDSDPDQPLAIVDVALGLAEAAEVARCIDGIYYIDRFIHARVMFRG